MGKISIYVMAHKKFEEPKDLVYVPLNVGAVFHDDLGYLRDDDGENISAKNPNFCELTGLYWAWKNDKESEYIGLCHYRRYFLDGEGKKLSGEVYRNFFDKCRENNLNAMIVSPRIVTQEGVSVRDFYLNCGHHIQDIETARDAISRLYSDYIPVFDEVMGGRETYFANMMVAHRSLIADYCGWLFKILFDMERRLDISEYDDYNKRVFGFISERLMTVWIKKNGIPIQECMVDMVDDRVAQDSE